MRRIELCLVAVLGVIAVAACAAAPVRRAAPAPSRAAWCQGHPATCFAQARELMTSDPPQRNPARVLLEAGCAQDNARACAYMAIVIDPSTDTRSEARAFVARSCALSLQLGCVMLAELLIADGDFDGARPRLQRACDAGEGRGCVELVARLQLEHAVPEAVAPIKVRALELARRDCASDDREVALPGCLLLARLVGAGYVQPSDPVAARSAYARACDMSPSSGCGELATLEHHGQGGPADDASAEVHARRGCTGGNGFACRYLGSLAHRSGDVAGAARLFERGCDLREIDSCRIAARLRAEAGDLPGAFARARRGCSDGDIRACDLAARSLFGGFGAPIDTCASLPIFDRICRWDDAVGCDGAECITTVAQGCNNAATVRLGGTCPDHDREHARRDLAKSCRLGDVSGCNNARQLGP